MKKPICGYDVGDGELCRKHPLASGHCADHEWEYTQLVPHYGRYSTGNWFIQYVDRFNNRQIVGETGFSTKKAAQEWWRVFMEQLAKVEGA